MNEFLNSNEWNWRLLRTVAQGVLGAVVANIDLLVGVAVLEPTWRALGLEPAAPDGFVPDEGEDGGFTEVADGS